MTQVKRSQPSSDGEQVARQRECKSNAAHRFDTVELARQPALTRVGVRHSGDAQLAKGAFDWDRLVRDVRASVLKSLDDGEILAVCNLAKRSLSEQLPTLLKKLTAAEARAHPELRGWITDRDISETVERHLRSGKSRVAHVLYALSFRGRADRKGRRGWLSVEDFLKWLYSAENYPDLRLPAPERQVTPSVDRWYPSFKAAAPARVIKKSGQVKPFSKHQFTISIRKAMLGRPNADESAELIAEWVLLGLRGQQQVHTAQLAVNVLDCLRRVDDVAYLRWAAMAKHMTTVTEVRDEAQGLLIHPSSRLVFDPSLRPRRPDSGVVVHPGDGRTN